MSKATEWFEHVRRLRQQRDLAQGVLKEAVRQRPSFEQIARVEKNGGCRVLRPCTLDAATALRLALWIADTFLESDSHEQREIMRRIRMEAKT